MHVAKTRKDNMTKSEPTTIRLSEKTKAQIEDLKKNTGLESMASLINYLINKAWLETKYARDEQAKEKR